MGKKILSNTILFTVILTFIKIFQNFFGSKNSLVGVTLIIVILVLMQENLTKKPVENFIKLLLLNLSLGIFAYISTHNIWIGLILNFATLSGIGYLLSADLNKVKIIPFGLQYLFMLFSPVVGMDFTKRIGGLFFGTVLIMIVQFIVYRKEENTDSIQDKLIESDRKEEKSNELDILGKRYKVDIVRGVYALKIGFLTAISVFIVDFFSLEQGRWIVYTVFSLTELYSENCKIKARQRLQGTVIGTLITLGLFVCLNSSFIKSLIALLGGYLDTYTSNYRDKMICVTISVVGSVSLVNDTIVTSIERISYVIIGIVLAILIDNLMLINLNSN